MNQKSELLHPDNPNGIYRYDMPLIGGIRQYVQIRGEDKNNPVLLFLHGGPGGAMSGITHIVHEGWEQHFTVVNWDQRGAGRTQVANRDRIKEIGKTGTMDDFMQDIGEVIAYLHTVLEFEKLILMGFSWGTVIGAEYARRHPEELLCYIGVGQLVRYRYGIFMTCAKLLQMAPKGSNDAEKVEHIIANLPEQMEWNRPLMRALRHFTPLCMKYIIKHARRTPIMEILRSPFWNLREKWAASVPNNTALARSYRTMLDYDFRENLHFEVPVLFVFGEEETVCPSELLQGIFPQISAPHKELAIIPQASHCCFYDNPERFMEVVSKFLGAANRS